MSGFHGNVTNNEIFDLNRKGNRNSSINQEELPHERITMAIRLSTERKVNTIKDMLAQSLLDFECVKRGTVITVSGFPPSRDFDTSTILAIAKKHDSEAVED